MKRKGFTLIELLAVIVILGLLMAIAIPSVTKYITQSRKKTLTNTIGNYMGALVNEVNDMVYTFTGTNTIYAVPIECIAVERGGTNPFGKWHQANDSYWAYVLVQYDDKTSSYKYGFTFKDSAGYGMYPVVQSKINENGKNINTGLDLNNLKSGLIIEVSSIDKWLSSGFSVNMSTKLKTLISTSEDGVGDGKTTCTLVQKGDNYLTVEEEKSKPVEKIDSYIYYHNGSNVNDAGDESYRYTGKNPKNYVCFGSDDSSCGEDNLYQIIGFFGDNVKLIKTNSIGTHYYNGTGENGSGNVVGSNQNYWYYKDSKGKIIESTLNIYLNNDWYKLIPEKWRKMIVDHEWNIGGCNNAMSNIKGFNMAEKTEKWIGKIGLLTVSDYAYGAKDFVWSGGMASSIAGVNWLAYSKPEWTMTRNSKYSNLAFYEAGYVNHHSVYNISYDIRPSFYLDSKVRIVSGTGTSLDPYRLSM